MDNIVSYYFCARRLGMKPANAWSYACSIQTMDAAWF